jgi:hypothetical protein
MKGAIKAFGIVRRLFGFVGSINQKTRPAMILKQGDKILIAHRRLFPRDEARYFIGSVEAYEAGIVKVSGYSYTRDKYTGNVESRENVRTKIVSLSSGTLFVYQLPEGLFLDALTFTYEDGWLFLTDGKNFSINLTEQITTQGKRGRLQEVS